MAVPKAQVSSWQQAYDYAMGSAASASGGVCPGATSVYNAMAGNMQTRLGTPFDRQVFLSYLQQADTACKADLEYAAKTGTPTAPAGSTSPAPKVDPGTGGAAPEFEIVPAGVGTGIPWWVWLAGGAALFLLLGGKKKGKK